MEQLEKKISNVINLTDKYFALSQVIPRSSDKLVMAEIIFKSTDYYLNLLKEIVDGEHKDLVSRFGANLLTHHNTLALCIIYLTLEVGISTPRGLDLMYNKIFPKFMDLLKRVEYEDILNDKSGLWRTYKL